MDGPTIPIVNTTQAILRDLGYRYSRGAKLSFAEENMAMMATMAQTSNQYGPSPAQMQLKPVPLPETVKGALAQFAI